MRPRNALGAVAVAAVVIVAALLALHPWSAPSPAPVISGPVKSTLHAGDPAPVFASTDFHGAPLNLADLRGKVVMVNFFASWCGDCRAEFPDIQAVYQDKRAAGFEVVGVDAIDGGDGRAFYRALGVTFPAVVDPVESDGRGPIARAYGVFTALPISVFIDRAGTVRDVALGRIDAAYIRRQISSMGIT